MGLAGNPVRGSAARLRSLGRTGAAALAALVLIACTALVALTVQSRRYAQQVTTLNDGLRAIDQIRIELGSYYRQSNLAYATKDPKHELVRSRLEADLLTRLGAAQVAVTAPQERVLLGKAARQIADDMALRRQTEARGVSPSDVLLASSPLDEVALDTLHDISRSGFDAVAAAEDKLAHWGLIENVLGVSIAVLVLVGSLSVAVGLRRLVFAPLLALSEGIDRFAAGDRTARVVPTGPQELQRTAESFNEMGARLERQNQDLLTFLAGVAHDLRNPLAAMRMGVQLLKPGRGMSEEKTHHTLEMFGRQTMRLERMVGDFLDATRIEGGYLELQLEPRDLRELAREVGELYGGSSAGHRILFSAPDRPVEVVCDGERVAQVLNNLVSNAIKYSPRGGDVVVSVEEEGDEATVSVRDSGIGISPADAEHIFEPFHRTGASRETAPGVGLGLSVARRIIEAHRGRIDVESSPGAGSTFRLHLPLAASAEAKAAAPMIH